MSSPVSGHASKGATPIRHGSPVDAARPRLVSPRNSDGINTPTKRSTGGSGSGAGGAGSLEARRARRAELRQFYGIKEGQKADSGQSGDEAGKADSGDPLDIDSSSFNASKYYENLITTASLADLIKTANTLSADVGNLQGSRHALVYNHHHQLFAAGDTIAQLNSRTPQLLSIMTSLQDSFSEISRLADSVALPVDSTEHSSEESWAKNVERLRLMRVAEEPAERINTYFDSFRSRLETEAENSDNAKQALQSCMVLVNALEDDRDEAVVAGKQE
ncbi:Vps51/Vps67-domain-containing protein [Kockovaella imperatae]|uniref:Vacuolar protein sorting-associated protein 51 homolog n=1 Tax=Kockovaella imperatae TaxID=4999 RepID=A0A1Y1US08_9TREE|nr:Vps51/Vps67-domain-containing protein [Kockovaella imperatae]ORX40823.1 Vps51/Vps67-domain-containing protein [Kockovaella imperatae]